MCIRDRPGSEAYGKGADLAGLAYSFENIVTFLFALVLPFLAAKIGQKWTHFTSLMIGGCGLMLINFVDANSAWMLFLIMALVGIAWSSILSMPYAMLVPSLPSHQIGVYMGIFNFFIVLPEIIASLFFGDIMSAWLDNSRIAAVTIGGVLLIVAGFLTLRIREENV